MKKFTSLIIPLFLFVCAAMPAKVWAQNNDPIPCQLTSTNSCYSIGYVAAFENVGSSPATTTVELQMILLPPPAGSTCPEITQVKITPTFGNNGTFEGDALPVAGSVVPVSFVVIVNSRTFDDNLLHIMVSGENGPIDNVFLEFTEECGFINPLPVELTEFKGKTTESGINLEWETASEINNSHFDVERSRNGKTFETIATVQGRGTTSVTSNYSLTDKLPQKGTNYYRLKQVDFDNTTSYSKTIAVNWDVSETMEVALVPNPCRGGDCAIEISNAANLETLVQLKDMTGRVVYSKTVRSDSHLLELPMAKLKQYKGLYFLTAATGSQVVHQRILLE